MFDPMVFVGHDRRMWRFIGELSRRQWLTGNRDGFRTNDREIRSAAHAADYGIDITMYSRLVGLPEVCLPFYGLCEVFRSGAKVFRPTTAQCEAMEEVQLTIRSNDYIQP